LGLVIHLHHYEGRCPSLYDERLSALIKQHWGNALG